MLSSTAYGRNIIPPHICYSIIVQMIDFLVNCTSAAYIIKICDFVGHGNPQPHIFLLTVYILYKKTKFPSNIVFTSQSHKVAYFDDVGSTCAIDQKINHLHNDKSSKYAKG
jgi:hypothetical protein